MKLRDELSLSDNDPVELFIPNNNLHAVMNTMLINKMVWYLCWWGREKKYYNDDYLALLQYIKGYGWHANQR